MHNITLDGNFLIEVEIGSGVVHDFLIYFLGCAEICRPPLAFCRGSVTFFLHTRRPTIGGRYVFLHNAREHAAQFGVARPAGGSPWKIPEAPADDFFYGWTLSV
jgi:hypothetical protein